MNSLLRAAAGLALLACIASPGLASEPDHAPVATTANSTDELAAAFAEFYGAIGDAEAFIRQHPFYREEENRAPAYAFLSAMMLKAIEHDIVLDPDYPFFRVLDFRLREGGDNPDQTYFMAPLRGGASYRIWGKRGSERRLDFQTYAGAPYAAGGGRMAGFLDSEKLATDRQGNFEVILSPNRQSGNWLQNPADGTQVLVRQVFSDWEHERPGSLHIDRIGAEGQIKRVLGAGDMVGRLRAAAAQVRVHIRHWPETVARGWARNPVNTIGEPFDAGPLGGVPGRWMARGNFELAPGEALLVHTWPMSGNYQGIQLADLWYFSLEYTNRQTSLTGDQAKLSSDGSFWFIVSAEDPGYANWLDTATRHRGVLLLRFDGMNGKPFDRLRYPTARKVQISELATLLPKDMARISPKQRSAAIAIRRRHVQLRLGR